MPGSLVGVDVKDKAVLTNVEHLRFGRALCHTEKLLQPKAGGLGGGLDALCTNVCGGAHESPTRKNNNKRISAERFPEPEIPAGPARAREAGHRTARAPWPRAPQSEPRAAWPLPACGACCVCSGGVGFETVGRDAHSVAPSSSSSTHCCLRSAPAWMIDLTRHICSASIPTCLRFLRIL